MLFFVHKSCIIINFANVRKKIIMKDSGLQEPRIRTATQSSRKQKAESRKQKAESRKQKAESRKQKAESRKQKAA
jgi:hypothetical protein